MAKSHIEQNFWSVNFTSL